jgi:hypothetical protein
MQAEAEQQIHVEVADCGHEVDSTGQVVLTGESPIASGSRVSQVAPNLRIEHVTTPVTKRGLPADVATNQNPLTAGRGRRA